MVSRHFVSITALLACGLVPALALQTWSLGDSATWSLNNSAGSANISDVPVTLPSCALGSLLEDGRLAGDPLYRYNELDYRWVADDTWTWTASFPSPQPAENATHWLLTIGAVDGVGQVALNGKVLAFPRNSHRPVEADVSGLLAEDGNNTLTVTIESAAAVAAAAAAVYPYQVPAVRQVGGLPHYNFIRKAASDFGWDWGPAFAPACILGDVTLTAYSGPYLTGLALAQEEQSNGSFLITATAFFQAPPGEHGGLLILDMGNQTLSGAWSAEQEVLLSCGGAEESAAVGASASSGPACAAAAALPASCSAVISLTVDPPFQRWWPWELGSPTLYDLEVRLEPEGAGDALSSLTRAVGLRSVELVTEALVEGGRAVGETFFLRVNGVPMFARGANVIPDDVLESAVTPARLARQVADARAVGMNMLRVWGGGRYAGDAFYAAADEAGLLVWQEVMAACAAYPRDAPFLEEVALEVRHQFTRLSAHPSVVLWGGNNEVEASFGWSPVTRAAPQLFAVDFAALFVDVVRPVLQELDPGVVYVDTSPSNGLLSSNPYVKRWGDVSDPAYGDVHFYDYTSDAFDPATYPPAKFVSEFGFMSFPSFSVYQTVTELGDWDLSSAMTDFRLRHAGGVQELQRQMGRHFLHASGETPPVSAFDGPVGASDGPTVTIGGPDVIVAGPNTTNSSESPVALQYKAFTHLSQVQQALAYETAAGVWRRGRDDPATRTMGMLYWQLNDIWQGPSWSSINHGGQWKLLHHAARRFFAPVYLSAWRDGDTLRASLVNDLPLDVRGLLSVDAVLYAARSEADVVTLLPPTATHAAALTAAPAWSGGLASLADAVTRQAQPTQLTYTSDYVLRLRFCPTAVQAAVGLPNPFEVETAGDGAGGNDTQVAAASSAGLTGSSANESCMSSIAGLGAAPGSAACAAASSALVCGEALFHPTEFVDASLWGPPPVLSARALPGAQTGDSGALVLEISSDVVALWVAVEPPPGLAGNFNASGFMLLPWQPQVVVFTPDPVEEGATGAAPMTAEELASKVTLRSLQQSMQEYEAGNPSSSALGLLNGVSLRLSVLGLTIFILTML